MIAGHLISQHLELLQQAKHSWSGELRVDTQSCIVFLHQQDPVTAVPRKAELTQAILDDQQEMEKKEKEMTHPENSLNIFRSSPSLP
jgi:hypothetical protein